ncbi:MBL fold metallo-hydrolase [Labrys monachus]|uniref:Glyoxylase-like metal-dependent hydrolase (Beta-lactamase superfamily II) n=1 Tax=Labrys monachus TaxID=217067 RepID=A0ABU0FG36_9HYPH|nr:MBL fold metallo-hydrolase [Labrys monachus]MDQ0393574.1 glyoxylase-like metal-dependent hydrolase (beta-lactamase superfamily II) [Labrys monachus]
MTARPQCQPSGLYHLAIGDIMVTAVNDGTFQAGFDLIAGIDHEECERLERASFRPVPPKMTMNAFLVETGGRRFLIDAGCGTSMGPTLGMACRNLGHMGVGPADIDAILVTHLHPDHVNGLVDDGGQAIFPRAELWVNEAELQFFRDPASPSHAPAETFEFFEGARRATAPYADRIRTIRDGSVAPGVTAITQPGHTPGHTGWLIESGTDAVMIWGDVVHMPSLQMAAPQACTVLDIDREQAIATRRRALDMAAADRLRVAGIHMDFPCFGHVDRRGEGYAFVPDVWRATV